MKNAYRNEQLELIVMLYKSPQVKDIQKVLYIRTLHGSETLLNNYTSQTLRGGVILQTNLVTEMPLESFIALVAMYYTLYTVQMTVIANVYKFK